MVGWSDGHCRAGVARSGKKTNALIDQHRHLRVHQRKADMLTLSCRRPRRDGRQNPHRRTQAAQDVGDANLRLHRRPLGLAGQAYQPGLALYQKLIARRMCIRPGLAKAGDQTVDQARVPLRQGRVVGPVAGQTPS